MQTFSQSGFRTYSQPEGEEPLRDPSAKHLAVLGAIVIPEVVLAFITPSLGGNQLLLLAALMALIGSIMHISDRRKAFVILWSCSISILLGYLFYAASGWLFFHFMIAVFLAVAIGLAIGLSLIARGKGLIAFPD